ncbi:MAG: hypothetical protein ACI9ZM_000568 [Paracoccaceae bacterium]|jgi:hypothetical protein
MGQVTSYNFLRLLISFLFGISKRCEDLALIHKICRRRDYLTTTVAGFYTNVIKFTKR